MPLESLICSHCGSSEVKEVKVNTYFCGHCEGIFKLVDPKSVTITNYPSFCSCGEKVAAKCQLCDATMCATCDAGGRTENWEGVPILIETRGFGHMYLSSANRHSAYGCFISDSQVLERGEKAPQVTIDVWTLDRGRRTTDLAIGPFVSVSKLLGHLSSINGGVRHVCWSCVASAIPEVAEGVVDGTLCEFPFCGQQSETNCRCCGFGYCKIHAGPAGVVDSIGAKTFSAPSLDCPSFPVTVSGDFCLQCRSEASVRIEGVVKDYPELTNESPRTHGNLYLVPSGKRGKSDSRRQKAEDQKAVEAASHRADEISNRLETLMLSTNCRRDQELRQDCAHGHVMYDHRDSVTPAAAPGVIGNR
jgi:hypothetical protein